MHQFTKTFFPTIFFSGIIFFMFSCGEVGEEETRKNTSKNTNKNNSSYVPNQNTNGNNQGNINGGAQGNNNPQQPNKSGNNNPVQPTNPGNNNPTQPNNPGNNNPTQPTNPGNNNNTNPNNGTNKNPKKVEFETIVVDPKADGAAFATVKDLDADGKKEIVISKFGKLGFGGIPNGEVSIYKMGSNIKTWTKTDLIKKADNIKFPNHTTVRDIDKDGDLGILVPSGFLVCTAIPIIGKPCGGILWLEKTATGYKKNTILPATGKLFFHHVAFSDLDKDGIMDIITVGEERTLGLTGQKQRAEVHWIKGTNTKTRFESKTTKISTGNGSFPNLIDLDNDGDLDIASAEFFVKNGSFAWLEQVDPPSANNKTGTWKRHIIDNKSGPSIMLKFVSNFYGDGKIRAVGANHTNTSKAQPDPWESAIYSFEIPNDPVKPWVKTKISDGIKSGPGSNFAPQAAPGIFGHGDLDNDGVIDLIVSGDGDPRVFWIEQVSPGKFQTRVLIQNLSQAGGMIITDIDGDGKNEAVVTGYDASKVLILKHK